MFESDIQRLNTRTEIAMLVRFSEALGSFTGVQLALQIAWWKVR